MRIKKLQWLLLLMLLAGCDPNNQTTGTMHFSEVKLKQVKVICDKALLILNDRVLKDPELHFTKIFEAQDLLTDAVNVLDRANIEDPNNADILAVAIKLRQIRLKLADSTIEYLKQTFVSTHAIISKWRAETAPQFQTPDDASYDTLLKKISRKDKVCCYHQINANVNVLFQEPTQFRAIIELSNQRDEFTNQLLLQERTLEEILAIIDSSAENLKSLAIP